MYIALPCNHSPLQVPQVSQNTPSSAQKTKYSACLRKFVWIWKLFVPGIETKEMRLDGAGQEYMDLFPASMFYDKRRMLAMSAFWDEAVSQIQSSTKSRLISRILMDAQTFPVVWVHACR